MKHFKYCKCQITKTKCNERKSSPSNEGIKVPPNGDNESGHRLDEPGVGHVALVLMMRSRRSPVARRPVMSVAGRKEELTPLDHLVLRLWVCRQNYGAWAQVTLSGPPVDNSAFAPSATDQVPKQTEHYCLPCEECGECTDTDLIMRRHAQPVKHSVNVSSFRSRKVLSAQTRRSSMGPKRPRKQVLFQMTIDK